MIETLQSLRCPFCPSIKEIPQLTQLHTLVCYDCPLITEIPLLERLKILNCSGCPVTAIPQLTQLQELMCDGCELLTAIPILPKLKMLRCTGCKFLEKTPRPTRYVNDGCRCLPDSPDYDPSVLQKIRYIQHQFIQWYYRPGNPGHIIWMRNKPINFSTSII